MNHIIKKCLVLTVLLGLNFVLGANCPWWTVLGPAFLAGWLIDGVTVQMATIAVLVPWFAVALYFDIPTGMRLSSRIAGVMGVPWFIFAYLAMALAIGGCVALACWAGVSLRAGLLRRLGPELEPS